MSDKEQTKKIYSMLRRFKADYLKHEKMMLKRERGK
jgi:hypothetical protein